ncbi:MAG TPA: phage holin family protein [Pseudonocardiaceae bacterium]|nr:phage holin family protein [Pseudonocardiaceae bacterium]
MTGGRAKICLVRLLLHVVITAVALWATTALPGIEIGGSSRASDVGALVLVALLFGLVNAVVKPVVKLLGCALYLVTLGLIGLVVNALLFLLTARIADSVHVPFHVAGFVPAFWGAIVVSVVSFVLHVVLDRFERQPQFEDE